MAKILLIETSGEVCSAAIGVDGTLVALSENLDTQSHAALLTLQIRQCSETAGIPLAALDAVALSRGPGAYTSLRVGASVAKGICYALGKPLIAVDTLLGLAYATRQTLVSLLPGDQNMKSTFFIPMLDARRQEVWLAMYGADLQQIAEAQPLILENNSFENYVLKQRGGEGPGRFVFSGNGMEKIRSGKFSSQVVFSTVNQCSARYLSELAEQRFQTADFQDIAYFEPFYMKAPNITTSFKPLF